MENTQKNAKDFLKRKVITEALLKQYSWLPQILVEYSQEVNKELQHFKDSSTGLHCTDRPDLVVDEKKILFELK